MLLYYWTMWGLGYNVTNKQGREHLQETIGLNNMNRQKSLEYVGHCLDDTGNIRTGEPIPANAVLVGWQCGFEPMVVAVWSYLPNTTLTHCEAEEIAVDYLLEINWFSDHTQANDADFIL